MKREIVGVPRERVQVVEPASGAAEQGGDVDGDADGSVDGEADAGAGSEDAASSGSTRTRGTTATVRVDRPSWVENVKNAIPAEMLAVWAAIAAAPGVEGGGLSSTVYWGLFTVACVVTTLYIWTDVESPTSTMAERRNVPLRYLKHSLYAQMVLAVGGFAVWAYYLGGPFASEYSGLYDPTYAIILLPVYVGLGPKLVPDLLRKVHGVEIPDERQRAPDEFLRPESE